MGAKGRIDGVPCGALGASVARPPWCAKTSSGLGSAVSAIRRGVPSDRLTVEAGGEHGSCRDDGALERSGGGSEARGLDWVPGMDAKATTNAIQPKGCRPRSRMIRATSRTQYAPTRAPIPVSARLDALTSSGDVLGWTRPRRPGVAWHRDVLGGVSGQPVGLGKYSTVSLGGVVGVAHPGPETAVRRDSREMVRVVQ